MNRPIGIDLFSGAGGLSLGFEQAGFDIVAAVEIDPIHACTHKFNFPDCAVIPRSVSGLSGEDIRQAAEIGDREIDVVFGGAPCQGFSLIGQRAIDDPRNRLVKDFVRLIRELKPRYFVFENVKGLTLGKHRQFLDELIAELDRAGYYVRLPWQVLNASSYGTPQDRQRLILMGARRGLPLPSYPKPTTVAAGKTNGGLPSGPTCQDALGDLPDAEAFPELTESDEAKVSAWKEPSAYARTLRCLDNDSWGFGYPRDWRSDLLTSSARTDHTEISRRRFAAAQPGKVEPISRFFKLAAKGIANTLRAGTDSARGAFTSPRPIHYDKPRCVTVREMARLHGFPDWFRFHTTKWHGARQIGNAVPPPLARAIGGAIIRALGIEPTRPAHTVKLGDPTLLRMGMGEAARFWGIEAPIGRRDRKSGAKKRKQSEIEAERLAEARG
ncbi:DNA cytosine methyltransferase [Oceanibaculum indicum]|uniref:Cytosine-specific methyltransferase n=1 Tax=Oceanibaculum indicum TaxID=526216 RepID=A0A420WA12_9PROT|nr:DNA cytosine methyltransferase [Oceanibaculum indicum]RKQ64149.1 DNA (cytosine-5)-methyltransferase 1 [Oceanibaculum indicum]